LFDCLNVRHRKIFALCSPLWCLRRNAHDGGQRIGANPATTKGMRGREEKRAKGLLAAGLGVGCRCINRPLLSVRCYYVDYPSNSEQTTNRLIVRIHSFARRSLVRVQPSLLLRLLDICHLCDTCRLSSSCPISPYWDTRTKPCIFNYIWATGRSGAQVPDYTRFNSGEARRRGRGK
jgi:hypothetical protein